MRAFIVFAVCILFCGPCLAQNAGNAVSMPIKVNIIDFETTKAICGGNYPPAWCPVHLLRDPENGSDAQEYAMQFGPAAYDGEEFAKRARIQKVKERLGYRRQNQKM